MSLYTKSIEQRLKNMNVQADPRHVEAFMRVEHGTLDALTPAQFTKEVKMALACIEQGGVDDAEELAKSYGL